MVTADCLLIEKMKSGDEDAFEEILEKYQPRVYRLAYRITGSDVDAEDVTQNVFFIIYNKMDSFRGASAPYSWIYKITLNASWEVLRSRKRNNHVSIEQYLPEFSNGGQHAETLLDWSNRPDDISTIKEEKKLVRKAIESLPNEYKRVIILRDIKGIPSKETAEILDLTVPAVKSRLHRARHYVRDKLESYYSKN